MYGTYNNIGIVQYKINSLQRQPCNYRVWPEETNSENLRLFPMLSFYSNHNICIAVGVLGIVVIIYFSSRSRSLLASSPGVIGCITGHEAGHLLKTVPEEVLQHRQGPHTLQSRTVDSFTDGQVSQHRVSDQQAQRPFLSTKLPTAEHLNWTDHLL